MALKSVIDIDVSDSKFVRFQELFQKYQDDLAKTPGLWAKATKEQAAMGSGFQRMAATMQSVSQMHRKSIDDMAGQEKHLALSQRMWTSMAHSSKDFAGNVVRATEGLLRWSGILGAVGGLLGAGGLWGIDRMAAGVSGQRRSAMGRGMSIGQQSAFAINLGRLVDPDNFLGWMNEMETDITKQGPAFSLTGRGLSGNTENDAVKMLKGIHGLAKDMPLNQLGPMMSAYGLPLSAEEQRRFTVPDTEFNQLLAGNAKDSKALNIQDDVAKKWQDLSVQLERAREQIGKTFVEGLVPLAPELEKLSGSFVHFLDVLMKSDVVKNGIDSVAHWLNDFSGELSSPAFLDRIKQFISDLGDLADTFHTWTHPGEALGKMWGNVKDYFAPTPETFKRHPDFFGTYLGRLDTHFGLPAGMLETIKQLEHSGANAVSPKGAKGMFQFMPDTAKQYGLTDPFDQVQSANAAGAKLADDLRHFHGNVAATLAAYNAGPGAVDAAMAKYGSGWQQHLPRETSQYILNGAPLMNAYGTRIEINNNTGGSATVSVHSLVP